MRITGPTWLRLFALTLLLLLKAVGGAPATSTSPDGSVFTVDINRPASADHDGDRNYRTLTALFAPDAYPKPGEHDVIWIAPGVYPGDLVIATKGLQLRATDGLEKTVIRGQVTLRAPDIMLKDLSIDAAGADVALRLDGAPGARLQHTQLSGARMAGLLSRESAFFSIGTSRIVENLGKGIWVSGHSQSAKLDDLQVQGNGNVGIAIEESDEVQIVGSTISLNGAAGIEVKTAQGTEVLRSLISNNAGPGLQLVSSGGSHIEANEFFANASFGVLLRDASDNALVANFIHENDRGHVGSGGIGIEGGLQGARGNRLARNKIEGQVQPDAAGIALRGRVASNEIRENQVSQNYRGITFVALGGESPTANRLIANQISASKVEGLRLEASGGANLIQGNEIMKSLQAGVRGEGGGRDEFRVNAIHDNGTEGIWLRASPDEMLSGNRIIHNGRAGLRVDDGSDDLWLADDWIAQNGGDGLALVAVRSARVQDSRFSANQGAGIRAQSVERFHVQGNEIFSSSEAGIYLDSAVEVELIGNHIHDHRQGGLSISGTSKQIELAENFFASNDHFSLKAEQGADVMAQRNWWGTSQGPNGVALGGPAGAERVSGLTLNELFPWLPAPPDQVIARSVRGLRLERIKGGEALDARDVAGAKVQLLSDVKGGPALLLLARPIQTASQRVGSQPALALAYVQIAGVSSGNAEIALAYHASQLPPQTSSQRLQLFRLASDGGWQALESRIDMQKQLVRARLGVGDLRDALIALAIASATNQVSAPQPTAPPAPMPAQPLPPQSPSSVAQPVLPKVPEPAPAPVAPKAGETLLLPAGEYTQDILLDQPSATLGSRDPAHPAIIHGHLIINAPNVTVQGLRLQPSGGIGLEARAAGVHILNNEIQGAQIGIHLVDGARDVEIRENVIEANELGLSLENVIGATVTLNRIAHNRAGGLFSQSSDRVTVERNELSQNGPFNVQAAGSPDLTAKANWWGDPRGPQDTALGVASEQFFPWLTMPTPQQQELTTLRFMPRSAGERFAQFLKTLLQLDLSQAWSALRDWASGTDTLTWQPDGWDVRVRLAGLKTSGLAILDLKGPIIPVFDLVTIDLYPEKITLISGKAAPRRQAVHVFRFDGQSRRWVTLPSGRWTIAPQGFDQQELSAWRWVLSP